MARNPNTTNFIVQRRKELDISQEELTARLQTEGILISRSTLSNWERGISTPPYEDQQFRLALAHALKLPIQTILKRAGYEVEKPVYTDAAERAAYIMEHLSRDKRDLALGILEKLLET